MRSLEQLNHETNTTVEERNQRALWAIIDSLVDDEYQSGVAFDLNMKKLRHYRDVFKPKWIKN